MMQTCQNVIGDRVWLQWNKAAQDAKEKKIAGAPKEARLAQTDAKERRVWLTEVKRKRKDSDAQRDQLAVEEQSKPRKRGRKTQEGTDVDEEDVDVLTKTKRKGKTRAPTPVVPAGKASTLHNLSAPRFTRECTARKYPAPDFDQASDAEDDIDFEYGAFTNSRDTQSLRDRLALESSHEVAVRKLSIQELLRVAVEEFRVKMLHQVLLRAAEDLDLPKEIIKRLKKDPDYNEALGGVPWARVSDWRAPLKVKAFGSIHTQYGPDLSAEALAALLHQQSYIYPGDPVKDTLKRSQPYEHPASVEVLREFHFTSLERRTGSKSIAARYPSHFEKRDGEDSTEIPDAMIASVGAAIHSSLKDRQNDLFIPSAFSADAVADVYDTHMMILEGLKPHHRRALKVKLYKSVT
ncbi:hypothetical protein HWV62_21934 [Athelia sp. TMB]|nr:hypothetical protein HWV62_21934 [Athelia sp. TMB]